MWRAVSFSMVDQVILSGLSLGINLALVTFSGPEDFGRFILALSVLLILVSLQNALIDTPLMIIMPRQPQEARAETIRTLTTADLVLLLASILLASALAAFAAADAIHALALVALVAAGLQREIVRSVLISSQRMARCVALDGAFAAMTVVAVPLLWQVMPPAAAATAGMALANAVAAIAFTPPLGRTLKNLRVTLSGYRAYWNEARWSLVGAMTSEVQNRLYVFVLEGVRGTAALGTLQAGRVVTSPVTLIGPTWGRVALPRMSALVGAGKRRDALLLLQWGVALTLGLSGIYALFLYAIWPHVEALVFRGRYPDIGFLVVVWIVYGLVGAVRDCISMFLLAEHRLREMAIVAIGTAILSSALLLVLLLPVPDVAALGCLLIGQTVSLIWLTLLIFKGRAAAPGEARDAVTTASGGQASPVSIADRPRAADVAASPARAPAKSLMMGQSGR